MKKSNLVLKIFITVLILATAVYIGVSIYDAATSPLRTELAVMCSSSESGSAAGYIVRTEKTVSYSGQAVSLSVKDGEKVAAGQELAVAYSGSEAIETAGGILILQTEISQLEELLGSKDSGGVDSASEAAAQLASAVARGDLSHLNELTLKVRTYVFGETGADSDRLLELKTELARLESSASGMQSVTADASSTFTSAVDGFEAISPEYVSNLSPSALNSAFSAAADIPSDTVGKLIYGITWYYAAVMSSDDASRLSVGSSVELRFFGTYSGSLDMTVENIGSDENGQCTVLFSCRTALADTASIRELTAEISFKDYSGIRVSKSALYRDEDGIYLYTVSGLQAKKAYVDIVCEYGDYYLVEGDIRDGTEIIVKARDLYDGKVVR